MTIPYKLVRHANSNLTIGDHTSVQSYKIDLRCPVEIGNHVIVDSEVEIITTSYNIDSHDWEHKYYGFVIEDYVWLATRVFVLPSCRNIGCGAICAADSVIANNINEMDIVMGNPAISLRIRKCVHSDLCVESLLGNDFIAYNNAYF